MPSRRPEPRQGQGRLGARYARRVDGDTLRVAIALIGLVVAAVLAWRAFD